MNIVDPVLLYLAGLYERAGIYMGFIALATMTINTLVTAASGNGLKIG